MVEFLKLYGLFLAKTVTIAIAIIIVFGIVTAGLRRGRRGEQPRVKVRKLNDHYDYMRDAIKDEMLSLPERKKSFKEKKKQRKQEGKKAKHGEKPARRKIFVLGFKGDLLASEVSSLREEVTAVLSVAQPTDEVVVRLESPGGTVHGYGLAASQLQRIKQKEIPLTIAVDKVAASGGYMMACVADKLLAAPFAIIGSIGVVSSMPNFHRLLKKNDIDFEQITAGEYKRTLTVFGENTPKAREKFTEQIEDTHALFKEFIADHRTRVDIDAVATGEYWYGKRALALHLVDSLMTSDDYLLAASAESDIFEVTYRAKETIRERIAAGFEQTLGRLFLATWEWAERSRLL